MQQQIHDYFVQLNLILHLQLLHGFTTIYYYTTGGSVAEWLACWTQALKGPGSNRSHNAVG